MSRRCGGRRLARPEGHRVSGDGALPGGNSQGPPGFRDDVSPRCCGEKVTPAGRELTIFLTFGSQKTHNALLAPVLCLTARSGGG